MFIHTPMFVHPPVHLYTPDMFICPPYICMPPRGCTHPPGAPTCFCAPAWFWHIACCGGGCFSVLCVLGHTTPYLGVPPPLLHPPHCHCWFSVHCYSQGYQFLCGPFPPSIEGFGGVPPITGGGWGDTSVAVHMLILLHLFL